MITPKSRLLSAEAGLGAERVQNVSQNVSQNVEDATFEIRIELKIAQATSQRLVEWTSESSRQCKWGRVLGWLPADHDTGNLVV